MFSFVFFIIDREALAKQGENALGSIHPSVRPSVCSSVRALRLNDHANAVDRLLTFLIFFSFHCLDLNKKHLTPEEEAIQAVQITEEYRSKALKLGDKLRIVYNRVPKTGSRTVQDMIRIMARSNGFTYLKSPVYIEFKMDRTEQEKQIDEIYDLQTPCVFDRHMFYINFTK